MGRERHDKKDAQEVFDVAKNLRGPVSSLSSLVFLVVLQYLSIVSSWGRLQLYWRMDICLAQMAGIFKSSSFGFEVKISQFCNAGEDLRDLHALGLLAVFNVHIRDKH